MAREIDEVERHVGHHKNVGAELKHDVDGDHVDEDFQPEDASCCCIWAASAAAASLVALSSPSSWVCLVTDSAFRLATRTGVPLGRSAFSAFVAFWPPHHLGSARPLHR